MEWLLDGYLELLHVLYFKYASPRRVDERSSALVSSASVPRSASSNPGEGNLTKSGFRVIFRLLLWLPEVGYNPAVGWSKNLL